VKRNQKKKALTLGALIHSGFRVCDQRRATGLLRLAGKAHLIVFQEPVALYDFLRKR
jgi:hypothetical protein